MRKECGPVPYSFPNFLIILRYGNNETQFAVRGTE